MTDNQWAVDCIYEIKNKCIELAEIGYENQKWSTDYSYLLGLIIGTISRHEPKK